MPASACSIKAGSDCEFTVYGSANRKHFPTRFYGPEDVPNEHRGKGTVGDACYRYVRTIFDRRNADPNAELVLGEVVTMPGRWSSYPPHHHPQPEIYHYRFTKPQGFGHAELGEQVLKVRQNDTVKILDGLDHAQCAAPGYGMYYAWVIRHLPDNPYGIPEFTEEHRWTTDPKAEYWKPQGHLNGAGSRRHHHRPGLRRSLRPADRRAPRGYGELRQVYRRVSGEHRRGRGAARPQIRPSQPGGRRAYGPLRARAAVARGRGCPGPQDRSRSG